jgi:hypothetical protein
VTGSGGLTGQIDVETVAAPAAVRATGAPARHHILFHILQDRHLPMTDLLAKTLAEFESAPAPAADPFWGRGYLLASGAIGLRGKMGNTLAWSRLFPVFVQTVAEPILRDVALRMGSVTLTTLAGQANTDYTESFNVLSRTIEDAVGLALDDQEQMGRAFWIAAGVALLGRFRKSPAQQTVRRTQQASAFPFLPDLNFAQLVYGIEPVFEQGRTWNKKVPRIAAKSKRLRVGIRPREGGVTGVQHSRRDTDIPDALSSAFILPTQIRLLKLLEEGFMIPRRPPYRRPDRDLLSMTVQTRDVTGLDGAELVKAAWVDATMRLRILLANMSMAKSELGFGQMGAAGTIAAAVTAQTDQPKGQFDVFELKGAMRAGLISMSSLMPNIFETVAPQNDLASQKRSPEPKVAAQDQIRAACATQAMAGSGLSRAGAANRPKMTDYAQLCLIEVAPRVVRGDEIAATDWRTNRKEIESAYDLNKMQDNYLGRILCPPVVETGAAFVLCSDDGMEPSELVIADNADPGEAIALTIGGLSSWIITQNILAVANE